MKKLICALSVCAATLNGACAAAAEPALKSPERIAWAVHCAGKMPAFMAVTLAVTAAIAAAAVIYYKKGDKKDGK